MGSVNVNRSLTDQFYRYKMPKIIAKVEGKGNGIKTVIVNMVDVAKALNRPPTYPTKFFGCELGAQTQFDLKNERFIVNGSHEASKLQDLLDGFIKRYVLCLSCDNPETVLSVNKKGVINSKCKACGNSGLVDATHKLATFIIKNPPDQDPSAGGASVQSGKKNRRKGKDDKSKKQNGEDDHSPQNESDNSQGDKDNGELDDDEDWAMDTDAQSVAQRMALLTTGAKGFMHDNDLEKSLNDRLNLFFEFLNQLINKQEDGKLINNKPTKCNLDSSYFKDIYNEADRLEVKEKASLVLCELLLNENILQQIKYYRTLLLKFTLKCHKAQKYLLGGIEQVIKIHSSTLMPQVSKILSTFYDLDILDEEVILEWASKVSKKYVSKEVAQEIHEKATPFIKWLNEAEVEESSSDDEEETVEVVYSDRIRGTSLQEIKEPVIKKSTSNSPVDAVEGDDDLDIDAI